MRCLPALIRHPSGHHDHGVPSLHRTAGGALRGDLGVTMLVLTPTKLDEAQRELRATRATARRSGPRVMTKHEEGFFDRLRDVFTS